MRDFPYPLYAQKEVWMHIPWASSNNDLDRWLGLLLTTTNHACTLCSTTLAHDVLSLSWYEGFFRANSFLKMKFGHYWHLKQQYHLFVVWSGVGSTNCTLCSTNFAHNVPSLNGVLESGWYKVPLSYMIYGAYYCPPFVKVGPYCSGRCFFKDNS